MCSPYYQRLVCTLPWVSYKRHLARQSRKGLPLKKIGYPLFCGRRYSFQEMIQWKTFEMLRDPRSIISLTRDTCGRVWWPSRQKVTSPATAQSGVFLAHNETRSSWMCEDMPYLPSPWESHTYSSHQPPKHDDSLAIPYLGARFNRSNQSTIQGSYLDTSGHRILYKMGWGYFSKEGYRPNICQFHPIAHNLQVWYSSQDCYW